ncbi:ABC transporter permease [Clostridium neuense]|uniref:ABC transporter permease n=1 Tax=Clostridium neuense TaxID=1728934 RepID=A0ABW8TKH7_9CLOT
MNMLSIIINSIKLTLKNKTVFFLEILFPVVLIFVFGIVLNGAMDNSKNFKDIKIGYYNSNDLNNAFGEIKKQGLKLGMKFYKDEKENAIKKVEDGKYTCFVEIKNNEIYLYKNDKDEFKINLVEGLMKTFVQRYNAIFKIAAVNMRALSSMNFKKIDMNLVKDVSISGKGTPGSMDYYAVTMLTYILIFSATNGFYAMSKRKEITNRIICSPVKKRDVILGKLLGNVAFAAIQILALILFSKFAFKAYWGENIGTVFFIALSEAAAVICIGMAVGFISKNCNEINTQVSTIGLVLGFLGGAFIPVKNMGKTFKLISNISPIRLINDAIFNVIYESNFTKAFMAIVICMLTVLIFMVIMSVYYERRVA